MKLISVIRPFIVPTLIMSSIALSTAGGYTLSIKTKVEKWEDKIYPGVTVNGIDLSGKTKSEAIDILNEELKKVEEKNLIVNADKKSFKINYKDLSPEHNIEDTVELAINAGKNEKMRDRSKWINGEKTKDIQVHTTYDFEKVDEFKEKIKKAVNTEPKNATLTVSNGKFNITDGKNGYVVNEEALDESIKNALADGSFENTEIQLAKKETEPKVTKETLSKVNGLLGSFSTTHTADSNRNVNLQLAVNACNGKVLMPGEVFSYNETLGKRTKERGYRDAGVFINNKLVQDVGGGICQVSTTLYRAAMNANLRSVERTNHMLKASYSDYGLDATVAWGSLDYKFKNTYKTPIYIQAYMGGGKVTFNIYGNLEEKGNKTYELIATTPETVGNKIKVSSYQITKENGKEIKREFVATDYYNIKADED